MTGSALLASQVQLEKTCDVAQLDKATELAMSAARAVDVDDAQLQELTGKPNRDSKRGLKNDGYDL